MPATNTRRRQRTPLTDAERDAKRQAERELMQQAVHQLTTSEGWQQWLRARAAFHRYSLHNQLLIALQNPPATRVAGFRAWLKLGYVVQKGQVAIRVWVPMPPTKAQVAAWEAAGADPSQKPRVRFRLGPVFDRSQVAPLEDFPGGPAPLDPPVEPIDGDSLAYLLDPLTELGAQIGSTITIEPVGGGADGYYDPQSRRIVVDVVSPAFSPNAQIATLIHELSHALVRADHIDEDPTLTRADEEVVVETVAHCVCASAGLDVSGSSVPYVASWARAGQEADTIERYARLIDRLARRLESVVADAAAPRAAT